MTSVKRPLEGSIGSQVHLQGDAKKVKLNVQKEDIDQGKPKILLFTKIKLMLFRIKWDASSRWKFLKIFEFLSLKKLSMYSK